MEQSVPESSLRLLPCGHMAGTICKARGGITKFSYSFHDAEGRVCGGFEWPTLAPSKHSPVKDLVGDAVSTNVRMSWPGGTGALEWQRTEGLYTFELVSSGGVIVTGTTERGRGIWRAQEGATTWQLRCLARFWRMRFDVYRENERAGRVREDGLFTLLRRRFVIDVPTEMSDPCRVMLFFLAVNATYR